MDKLLLVAIAVSVLFCLTTKAVSGERFYIVTSQDRPCPGSDVGEPCITLEQYASNLNPSRQSNITLQLEAGNHRLSSTNLTVSDINSFQIVGADSNGATTVTCTRYSTHMNIETVSRIQMRGVTLVDCRIMMYSVGNFTLEDSNMLQRSTIYVNLATSLNISRSNFSSFGQYLLNIFNTRLALFEDSAFTDVVITVTPGGCIRGYYLNAITIRRCTFTNLRGESGALYVDQPHYDYTQITVEDSNFTGNNLGYPPGPNYYKYYTDQPIGLLRVFSGPVTIIRCNFIDNYAYGHGGVFAGSSVPLSITNSTFVNNSVNAKGGAIFNSETDSRFYSSRRQVVPLSIRGSTFINNLANQSGGVIYASVSDMSIHDSLFENNTAVRGGGAVLYTDRLTASVLVSNSTFTHNTASQCGVLQVENALSNYTVNFTNSVFRENKASGLVSGKDKGGVACLGFATLSITNSAFKDNYARGDAGVAYVDDCNVNAHASEFSNNRAGRDGGVFATKIYPTNYTIDGSSFTHNHAASGGGVLYIGRAGSRVNVNDSSFESNSARNTGGVAVTLGSRVSFTDTVIANNRAYWGDVFRACNSEVMTPNIDLFTRTDPNNSLCTLYYESSTTTQEDNRESEVMSTTDTSDISQPSDHPVTTPIRSTDSTDTSDTTDTVPATDHFSTLHMATRNVIVTNDGKPTAVVNQNIENRASFEEGTYHALTIFALCVCLVLLVLMAILYMAFIVYILKTKNEKSLSKAHSTLSEGSGGDASQMTSLLSDKDSMA